MEKFSGLELLDFFVRFTLDKLHLTNIFAYNMFMLIKHAFAYLRVAAERSIQSQFELVIKDKDLIFFVHCNPVCDIERLETV